MLAVYGYRFKKDLVAAVGQRLKFEETSMFGREYDPNGHFAVVGPSKDQRKWFASVTMRDGIIIKVT